MPVPRTRAVKGRPAQPVGASSFAVPAETRSPRTICCGWVAGAEGVDGVLPGVLLGVPPGLFGVVGSHASPMPLPLLSV